MAGVYSRPLLSYPVVHEYQFLVPSILCAPWFSQTLQVRHILGAIPSLSPCLIFSSKAHHYPLTGGVTLSKSFHLSEFYFCHVLMKVTVYWNCGAEAMESWSWSLWTSVWYLWQILNKQWVNLCVTILCLDPANDWLTWWRNPGLVASDDKSIKIMCFPQNIFNST